MKNASEPTIARGIYQHYKGPHYQVLDVVRHSESEEWLVYYRTCYGDWSRWVRPYDMFVGTIEIDGVEQRRFAYIAATLSELGLLEPTI